MQSRLFSTFMAMLIAPPLIQQLQPRFIGFRKIYESREANSKVYSWFAFITGVILVEIPFSIIAGTISFQCWWWGAIGHRSVLFDNAFIRLQKSCGRSKGDPHRPLLSIDD